MSNEFFNNQQPVLEFSDSTNLLEQSDYKFSLQNRENPNLYRHLFEYDTIPKVAFNHRFVPMNTPSEIWMTDTTFRDGQQSTSPFTVKHVVDIFKLLHKLGGPKGLVRQSEFFVYTEKDRRALQECMALGYEFPEVTSWIRANEKDFELVKQFGVKETGMLMSCSDYHIFKKLGKTRSQTMADYLKVAEAALKAGIRPRCHLEDLTRADIYGFVVPLVKNLKELCEGYGVSLKVRACDTLGIANPFPNGTMPRSVCKLMDVLRRECGLLPEQIEWHGHNDFHYSVANSVAAWMYGAGCINSTLLGIGERCGNTPLEGMLFQYGQFFRDADLKLDVLNDVSDFFGKELDYHIHEKYPLMGADFNTTKAGIHADGLLKDPEIYNSFDTKKIFSRPIVIMINQASGSAGIAGWINNYYNLPEDEKIDKRDPRIEKIRDWVTNEYENGRSSNITNEELRRLVETYIPHLEPKYDHEEMAGSAIGI